MKSLLPELGRNNTCNKAKHNTFGLTAAGAIQFYTVDCSEAGTLYPEENVLLFIISGHLTVTHGAIEESATGNQLIFIKKKILVSYQIRADTERYNTELILFSIGDNIIKEFTKLAALPVPASREDLPFVIATIDPGCSHFIATLSIFPFYPQMAKERLTRIKLLELLFFIAHHQHSILAQLLHLRETFQPDITSLVEENILNTMSLHQLAVKAGRSLSSFRRDFLSIYNMPPSQWIRQRRLQKAQELLLSTNMSITDICYTTGFENIAHFSRLFKSRFQHSPSCFRQQFLTA